MKTTRRPPVRKAPWKAKGWRAAPGALPHKDLDPEPLAAVLAASGNRAFTVGVYASPDGTRHLCYTSARTLQTLGGYCGHTVTAKSRASAIRLAVAEHKERCHQT